MNLIQCDEDCIYQCEGYCTLETPAVITNNTGKGCVHKIKVSNSLKPSPSQIADPSLSQYL